MSTRGIAFQETTALRETEKSILLAWLLENPGRAVSRRDVAAIIKKEVGNATRCVADLIEDGVLLHSHDERCSITGRKIEFLKFTGTCPIPRKVESGTERNEPKQVKYKQLTLFSND